MEKATASAEAGKEVPKTKADENKQSEGSVNKTESARVTSVKSNNADVVSSSSSVDPYPSVTFAIFLYWVLPVVLLSVFGRQGVDTDVAKLPSVPVGRGTSIQVTPNKLEKAARDYERKKKEFEEQFYAAHPKPTTAKPKPDKVKAKTPSSIKEATSTTNIPPSPAPSLGDTSSWPTSYLSVVNDIQKRRPRWQHGPLSKISGSDGGGDIKKKQSTTGQQSANAGSSKTQSSQQPQSPKKKGGDMDRDGERKALREKIEKLKQEYEHDPNDIFKAFAYAEGMRHWGVTFFDGGSYDTTAINVYTKLLIQLRQTRQSAQDQGKPTDITAAGTQGDVAGELTLAYDQRSLDGLLCVVYTSLGKLYFMANMFERSEEALSHCLDIEPAYLDAAHNRGSVRIVLGKLEEAAKDYMTVIANDIDHVLPDAFSGLARILEAKEDAIPEGWDFVVSRLEDAIPRFETILPTMSDPNYVHSIATGLRRYHHALFVYHDKKTKDIDAAWNHLTQSHRYKLKTYASFHLGSERNRLKQIQMVFKEGFWPPGMGSPTKTPIFVIGFARSGSTLLERVLDAHPRIVGMGENSVFNGRLDYIRTRFVEASSSGQDIPRLALEMADEVVDAMQERWEIQAKNTQDSLDHEVQRQPYRFVDKMLTNYFNVGFINMLYPNALILHVIREPMDTIFSCFKHDFPSERLAYTADPKVLTELYTTYRDVIDHWESVLPGRITHVRYEDMVNDMPGMARAIISSAGLEWDDSVLDFHTKKHAVNTYSSTQVRKKVYKDAIQSWKRYEGHLGPMMELLGEYVKYDRGTSLPGYRRPTHDEL